MYSWTSDLYIHRVSPPSDSYDGTLMQEMNERQFSKLDYKEWHIGVVSNSSLVDNFEYLMEILYLKFHLALSLEYKATKLSFIDSRI